MPAYSGPTAAVMVACLSQNSTLSTRLPGKHRTEPATALQGGRTHLTPPPEPQRRPRGICNCLPASAVSVTASPILEKPARLPAISSPSPIGSLPFPNHVHGWVTGREDDIGQEAGHEPASFGPRLRRLVHRRERGGSGHSCKAGLACPAAYSSSVEMEKEQHLVAKGCRNGWWPREAFCRLDSQRQGRSPQGGIAQ